MTVLATFARLYVQDLDGAIGALQASDVGEVRLRFGHASGLQLALVGDVLVLAGTEQTLAPFRRTDVTLVVDDLGDALDRAQSVGAQVVRAVAEQATGRNATLAFRAGPVVEYVEWDDATRLAAGLTTA